MTDKPTPTKEQIQRACDLANATAYEPGSWELSDYSQIGVFTALADTIAKLDAMQAERDEARSERAAANIRASELKLGFDKATADLGAIDEIAAMYGWGKPEADIGKKTVAAIAAPYRVETDPLDDLLWQTLIAWESGDDPGYGKRLGSPEGLPAWDTAKAAFRAELAKRGLEIGRQA